MSEPSESVIGIIRSEKIKYKKKYGFCLLITNERIIGKEMESMELPQAIYFNSKPFEEHHYDITLIEEFNNKKKFEFQKKNIYDLCLSILPFPEGFDGYLFIIARNKNILLDLKNNVSCENGFDSHENEVLTKSLSEFAPDHLTIEPYVFFIQGSFGGGSIPYTP